MVGGPSLWATIEGFGTIDVTASGLEKATAFGRRQVLWRDVRRIQLTRNRDGVRLDTGVESVVVSLRLVNLAVFARAALDLIPRQVLDESPDAVNAISTRLD